MTRFMDPSFSTYAPGDDSYRDNWERTFGKKATPNAGPDPYPTASEEREVIANYIAEHSVLLSGHVRKPWLALAEEIQMGAHWFHDAPKATPTPSATPAEPDFHLEARRWLGSWKAFDADGPEMIPRITESQLRNLTASLEAVLIGAHARGERATPSSCKAESPPTMCDGCGLHPAEYCLDCCS